MRVGRALRALLIAPAVAASPIRAAIVKRRGVGEALQALPVTTLLFLVGAGGQAAGHLLGAGRSPRLID